MFCESKAVDSWSSFIIPCTGTVELLQDSFVYSKLDQLKLYFKLDGTLYIFKQNINNIETLNTFFWEINIMLEWKWLQNSAFRLLSVNSVSVKVNELYLVQLSGRKRNQAFTEFTTCSGVRCCSLFKSDVCNLKRITLKKVFKSISPANRRLRNNKKLRWTAQYPGGEAHVSGRPPQFSWRPSLSWSIDHLSLHSTDGILYPCILGFFLVSIMNIWWRMRGKANH